MSEPIVEPVPPTAEQEANYRAQEIRTLAIQVAANRCEDVSQLIKFASEIESYLLDGTVPVSE